MNPQILKDIKALSTTQPEHIRKYDRMVVVIKFMQTKKEHPDYNKNQLCSLIGVSNSYLKRIMKDLDIKSFYRHDIPINKNNKKINKNTADNNQPVIKNPKEIKTKRKSQQLKGDGINPENITDEFIEKLIN
jgi:hypothetical protein